MAFFRALHASWKDGNRVTADLFKSLIPIIVLVKILSEAGFIQILAKPLAPVMELVGLPSELGLAWAAAILVNIYSGMMVLMGLLPGLPPLSVGQITTLALLFLIAHNMILETRLAGQCGLSMPMQFFLRLGMAVLAGFVMFTLCRGGDFLSAPAVIHLEASSSTGPVGLAEWARNEAFNLVKIYLIIWAMMLLQRGLDHFRITHWLGKVLRPLLLLLGLSPQCATIIIVGFVMGLIYGSGVILKNVREGTLSKRDVFCSLSIMGVAHSLVEDTLLMLVLGASPWGVLFLRLVLAMALGLVLNRAAAGH